MGVPKNKEACPADNGCWAAGCTPYYLELIVQGVIASPEAPYPPPNGLYHCEQKTATHWEGTCGIWKAHVYQECSYLFIDIHATDEIQTGGFWGYAEGTCKRTVDHTETYPDYQAGSATYGYEGPPGATGQGSELAADVGIIEPDSCQFEYVAAADGSQTVRIAQKKDGTRVFVRRDSET